MTGTDETKGDGLESHHMPGKIEFPLHPIFGQAIQMDPRPDHLITASHSEKVNGPTYAAQRALFCATILFEHDLARLTVMDLDGADSFRFNVERPRKGDRAAGAIATPDGELQ